MIPYVEVRGFELLGLAFHPFGVLIAAAAIAGFLVATREGRLRGLDPDIVDRVCIYSIAVGLVGSALGDALLYRPSEFLADPLGSLDFRQHMSSMAGIASGSAFGVAWLAWRRAPILPVTAAVFTGLAFGWAIARLGCALVHDHPGTRSDFVLAVRFPGGPRHDLGLYEFLFTVALCVVLARIDRRNWPAADILALICLPYLIVRFFLDYLRVDDARYFGHTPAQIICGVLAAVGATALLLHRARRQPRAERGAG